MKLGPQTIVRWESSTRLPPHAVGLGGFYIKLSYEEPQATKLK
ncbi:MULTISPECIES: hypothetical protein [unclassified Nitrospina]